MSEFFKKVAIFFGGLFAGLSFLFFFNKKSDSVPEQVEKNAELIKENARYDIENKTGSELINNSDNSSMLESRIEEHKSSFRDRAKKRLDLLRK